MKLLSSNISNSPMLHNIEYNLSFFHVSGCVNWDWEFGWRISFFRYGRRSTTEFSLARLVLVLLLVVYMKNCLELELGTISLSLSRLIKNDECRSWKWIGKDFVFNVSTSWNLIQSLHFSKACRAHSLTDIK